MWPESLRRLLDAHEGYRSRRGVTHAQLAAGARVEGCSQDPLEARVGAERVATDPLKVVPQVRAPRAHAFQHLDGAVVVADRDQRRGREPPGLDPHTLGTQGGCEARSAGSGCHGVAEARSDDHEGGPAVNTIRAADAKCRLADGEAARP